MEQIRITLAVSDGKIVRLDQTARDTALAPAVLVGLPAADLPRRIGAVYSLCSRAQTIAALGALEAAAGTPAAPGVQAARDVLRQAEMMTQLAMRLALHWPRRLDLPADPALPRACLAAEKALEEALFSAADWKTPGAGCPAADLSAALRALDALADAAGNFIATHGLRAALADLGLEGFGALPDGLAPEGGSFSRRWAAPAVTEARAAHGPGLAARLEAGLAELAALPIEIRATLPRVQPSSPCAPRRTSGRGHARLDTARGPLDHDLEIAGGLVAHYAISAPTETNFRPGGPLQAGLIGAAADDLERAAGLHIVALDPCVEFTLEMTDA